jgi:hypothetical protein
MAADRDHFPEHGAARNRVKYIGESVFEHPEGSFVIVFRLRLVQSWAAANAMNAKSIVRVAVLTVICLVASRQHAAAVAGVYYVTMTNGYNFVANQLNATDASSSTNNSLTNVVINPPEGTKAYQWDVTNQFFSLPATFHTNGGWNTNFDCPPGKGFVIFTDSQWSNTFVGQVPSGSLTNFVAGGNLFSLLACKIPLAGKLSADLGFPGTDGDDVYLFRTSPQSYTDAFTYFTNYGWFDPKGFEGIGGPGVQLGESFFVQNPGTNANWVIQFEPFFAAPSKTKALVTATNAPSIRRISVRAGKTTLDIANPGGGSYNVQFSSDGSSWSTVAANQTSTVWTGAYPGGRRGYYHVVRP